MTFPLAVPGPVAAAFNFFQATALAAALALFLLGLYDTASRTREFPEDHHAPLVNGRRRRPTPTQEVLPPGTVKRRLPPVEFVVHLAERSHLLSTSKRTLAGLDDDDDVDEDLASTCRVCLERLEPTDEVRRLGNCAHAFHRRCIDRWIDVGELTCPLCRSNLLPGYGG
ncbi:unnamed protein product [Alopecurus aequalis]